MQIKKNPRDCRERKYISRIVEYENFRMQGSWPTNSQKFTIRTEPRSALPIPVECLRMKPAPPY